MVEIRRYGSRKRRRVSSTTSDHGSAYAECRSKHSSSLRDPTIQLVSKDRRILLCTLSPAPTMDFTSFVLVLSPCTGHQLVCSECQHFGFSNTKSRKVWPVGCKSYNAEG